MPELAEPPTKTFAQSLFAEADTARLAEIAAKAPSSPVAAPVAVPPATPPAVPSAVEKGLSAAQATPSATPPVTPPVEADPDAEIESGKRAPKSEDFKRVKEKLKHVEAEAKTKLTTYETELAELRKAPKHNAKLIEELTAERDRYKTIHDTALLEVSTEFQAKHQARMDAVLNPLKAELPADKAEQITRVLTFPDGAEKRKILAELVDGLDTFTQLRVVKAADDARAVMADRQAELTKAQESLGKIAADRMAQRKTAEEESSKVIQSAIAKAKTEMPIFQPREKDEAWNKEISERERIAQSFYRGDLTPEERADAALWAASAPTLLKQNSAQAQEIESLKATIAKLQGAGPKLEGGGRTETQEGDPKRPFTSNFEKWRNEVR